MARMVFDQVTDAPEHAHLVLLQATESDCGYDRPVDNFFIQVWSRAGNLLGTATFNDLETLYLALNLQAGVVPVGLYVQLQAEASGQYDTNTCKDWRCTKPSAARRASSSSTCSKTGSACSATGTKPTRI